MRNRYELNNPLTDVYRGSNYERKHKRNSIHSISAIAAILCTFYLIALYGFAYFLYGLLPTPLTLSDKVSFFKF